MARFFHGWHLGRRIAPPRFLAFVAVMIAGAAAAVLGFQAQLGRALMIGFDLGAATFLVSLYPLLDDKSQDMRDRARDNDANRIGLLAITGLVMVVVLIAVADELSGNPDKAVIALVLATLALAWLFSNTIYALHYAHLFYGQEDGEDGRKDAGGVNVPETDEPDYWDFVYFAFTLGMTFQTSDVEVTTRPMRRVVIGHCLAAFVFNLGVLAFTINTLGG